MMENFATQPRRPNPVNLLTLAVFRRRSAQVLIKNATLPRQSAEVACLGGLI
jgi:hypothetical protein